MKINGHEIEFTDKHPDKEGTFLWRHSIGVETIYVIYYPPKDEFGVHFDGCYGIPDMRGRNVRKLQGVFCEIELDKIEPNP
jgi:hypothetical protein